jgi:glycosyltransferase involved in cell wall biosynthesis
LVGRTNAIFDQENLELPTNIILKSDVSDVELEDLYKNATATILPSIYEGFGRPILESLYFGTEVICSDIPVFKENFKKFVHYFDPNNSDALLQQLRYHTLNVNEILADKCPSHLFSYTFAAHTIIKSL